MRRLPGQVKGMEYFIRPAKEEDAAALAAIYAPYTETPITFESPAPTAEEFRARIAAISASYPFLVCEGCGEPLGYAYAHRYRERAAYDWDAELSIYLSPALRGRGAGHALYTALFSLLREQGFVNIYGCVAVPNAPSERLHEAMGMELVFTDRRTAWKLGAWRDLAFYKLRLAEPEGGPPAIIPFRALPADTVSAACAAAGRLIRSD